MFLQIASVCSLLLPGSPWPGSAKPACTPPHRISLLQPKGDVGWSEEDTERIETLDQGQQTFSVKDQKVNTLDFVGHSALTAQYINKRVWLCSSKNAIYKNRQWTHDPVFQTLLLTCNPSRSVQVGYAGGRKGASDCLTSRHHKAKLT